MDLDSDLIMLSLFHCKPFDQFFIYRETPEFGKKILNDDNMKSEYLFLNIHTLSKAILSEMNCDNNDYHRLYDYIFMCFLLGNDFLPHFPSLNLRRDGIDILLETYKSFLGSFSQRSFINKNWKFNGDGSVYFLQNSLKLREIDLLMNILIVKKCPNGNGI